MNCQWRRSENEAARAPSEIMRDWYPDIDNDEGNSVWIIARNVGDRIHKMSLC